MRYFLVLLFSAFCMSASAQIYIRQNTFYGIQQYRSATDSTFLFPAGNGAPSGIASLRSINIGKPGLYGDTANKQAYIFWGKDSSWSLIGGSTVSPSSRIFFVEDSTDTQPGSPADSTYWLTGGTPTGASGIWTANPHKVLFFSSGVYTVPTQSISDYAVTTDTVFYHQYNGTTWPRVSPIDWNVGGNPYGGILGSTTASNVFLQYNKINRIILQGNGVRFPGLTGTLAGIMGLDNTTGLSRNIQPGKSIAITSSAISFLPVTGGASADSMVVYNSTDGALVVAAVDYARFILASPVSKQHKIADIDTLLAYNAVLDTIIQRSGTASAKSYFTDSTWYLKIINASGSGKNFNIGNTVGSGGYGTGTWYANLVMPSGTSATLNTANILSSLGVQGGIYAYGNAIISGNANPNDAGSDFTITGSEAGAGSFNTSLDGGTMVYKAGLSRGPLGVSKHEFYVSKGGAADYTLNTSDPVFTINGKGVAEYYGNPSLYFTDSSLTNKIYVDSSIAASGGGGSQDLQDVTDLGNTTTDTLQSAGINLYDGAAGDYAHAYEYDGEWHFLMPGKGSFIFTNASDFLSTFAASNSADRQYNLPNASGTIALTSDIPSSVTSVSGTTDRITSTGDATPVIDISATFEALLGKVANPLSQFAATTSAQLRGVLSDELGTGAALFDGATPTGLVLTNATGLPLGSITGLGTGVGTALAINVGSAGAPVLFNGAGGTPSSINLSNGTALPLATGTTGILPDASYQYTKGIIGASWAGTNTLAASTTQFLSPMGAFTNFNGTEGVRQWVCPVAGTIRTLYITTGNAQSGTGTFVFTVRKNGANTAVVATVTAGGAAGNYTDLSNSVTVAAGDLISVQGANNASATSAIISSVSFQITNY